MQNSKETGFTIIEVAIVMIIIGVLLAGVSSLLLAQIRTKNLTETNDKLETIDEALQVYLEINGRYPCVARNDSAPDTINYGREIGAGDCTAAPAAGTTTDDGVRIGSVPTRTLNLPDDYTVDAWGRRFTYAVTEVLATDGTYNRDNGAVTIQDSNGFTVVTPADSGHYMIVSHGEDGSGAVPRNGGARLGCPAVGATLDEENCNDDDTFIDTTQVSDVGAAFYDDIVLRNISNFVTIPAGAVMAFNAAVCPDGWNEFEEARGRTIVGTGLFNENFNNGANNWNLNKTYNLLEEGGVPFWLIEPQEIPGFPSASVTINHNSAGPDATNVVVPAAAGTFEGIETMTPFVSLLYCERN